MNSSDRGIDVNQPQAARRYDALLGGKDNFQSDRASAERIRQELPVVDLAARELRHFLQRAVHYLAADRGIRHFLDIGCGLPRTPNVHEIVQAVDPASRVVYVDPDPIVGVHARALLTSHPDGATYFCAGGLDDLDAILSDDTVRGVLDFSQPVAVLMLAVLHFVPDDQHARNAINQITAAVAPGSYIAVSHVTFDPLTSEHAARLCTLAGEGGHGPFRARTHTDITALLHGLDLVEPGLVSVVDWHPDRKPRPLIRAEQAVAYGAVARTPGAEPRIHQPKLEKDHESARLA